MTIEAFRTAFLGRPHKAAALVGDERFAAVAAVLRERAGRAEVLLIRRAQLAGDPWSGHMAFPGGRQDPADRDLLHTALRETEEEVGLRLHPEAHLVGRLDDLQAVVRGQRIGMVIAPFVFAVAGEPALLPNPSEVEEVLWAPVSPLLLGERNTTHAYEHEGRAVALPGYDVDGRIVWGLTHRMLGMLFDALGGSPRGA